MMPGKGGLYVESESTAFGMYRQGIWRYTLARPSDKNTHSTQEPPLSPTHVMTIEVTPRASPGIVHPLSKTEKVRWHKPVDLGGLYWI